MRLRFVVPSDVDAPTGGNVYDLAVTEAARDLGHHVELVRCSPPDLPTVVARRWPGPTLVDGLLACPQPDALAATPAAVLVHMPLAWEAGPRPGRAAELDRLEGRALRAATAVVATSSFSAAYLRRRHGLADVVVAAPGVTAAAVAPGSDPPLLVQVAALVPNKNQLALVEALSGVRDLPWRARLAGAVDRDPAYAAEVRQAVAASGLADRVEIPGVMTRDAAWAGADLALLPSRREAFGLVVTEALARGIPAVVTEGGAVEALGRTGAGLAPGMVVPVDDVAALAHAVRGWLTDQQLREELRTRAVARRDDLEGWQATARRVLASLGGR